MRNAGEHIYSTFDVPKPATPTESPHALSQFIIIYQRRLGCIATSRVAPPATRWPTALKTMMPHQGGEKCESPRNSPAARAALAHAVLSRTTAVRRFASPHLGLPLPPRVGHRALAPHATPRGREMRESENQPRSARRTCRCGPESEESCAPGCFVQMGRPPRGLLVCTSAPYVRVSGCPRAGYTHTAHAVCAWGWGPGTMRSSHGATHRPIRNDGRRSHSRWVDPHNPTIGLTRERATRTRLTRLARGVGARVPCERATVQPPSQL